MVSTVLLKFYPDPSDGFHNPGVGRFREIIKEIIEDINANWKSIGLEGKIELRPVYNGMRGGAGPCYALETEEQPLGVAYVLKTYLEDKEPVYSITVKKLNYRGNDYEHAMLIRLG